jgi:hypothetical protein
LQQELEAIADRIAKARSPLLLLGRGTRAQEAWNRRIELAELAGFSVLTSIRERAVFPTDHPAHVHSPFYWAPPAVKDIIRSADFILSLDWVDLNGLLLQVTKDTGRIAAEIAHVSLDRTLHNGWSMDHFSLPPVDYPVMAPTASSSSSQRSSSGARRRSARAVRRPQPARPSTAPTRTRKLHREISRWRCLVCAALRSFLSRTSPSAGRATLTISAIRSTFSATTEAPASRPDPD